MQLALLLVALVVELGLVLVVRVAEQGVRLEARYYYLLVNIYLVYFSLGFIVGHAHDIDDVQRVELERVNLLQFNRWF